VLAERRFGLCLGELVSRLRTLDLETASAVPAALATVAALAPRAAIAWSYCCWEMLLFISTNV